MVFAPDAAEVYAADRSVTVCEANLSRVLCGASRPGHFDGVCTVVAKLFNLCQPDEALFGKKDYQQLAIIRRMVRDLNFPVTIHGMETVREADGLAMSSRNRYLTEAERVQAAALRAALLLAREAWRSGMHDARELINLIGRYLRQRAALAREDYIQVVDRQTLQPMDVVTEEGLIALAVFFDKARLIDNIELIRE